MSGPWFSPPVRIRCTRRGFFLASQITKLPCALLAGVLAWLAGGLNAVAGGVAAGLLAACLAELLGTICIRFGSKASANQEL